MHRAGLGGGLLTAVIHELEPVLVNQCDAAEIGCSSESEGGRGVLFFFVGRVLPS